MCIYVHIYIYRERERDNYKVLNALAKNQKYAFPEDGLLHKGHGLKPKRKESEGSVEQT